MRKKEMEQRKTPIFKLMEKILQEMRGLYSKYRFMAMSDDWQKVRQSIIKDYEDKCDKVDELLNKSKKEEVNNLVNKLEKEADRKKLQLQFSAMKQEVKAFKEHIKIKKNAKE